VRCHKSLRLRDGAGLPHVESESYETAVDQRVRTFMKRAIIAGLVFVGVLVVPASAQGSNASAPAHPVIQPGAEVRPGHSPLGPMGGCTLNLVFTDANDTYIGTSGRCTHRVGERVATPSGEEFGTVVFRVMTGSDGPEELVDSGPIDDFALIQVDESYVPYVSPVILGLGRRPTGLTTSGETHDGAALFTHGQGVAVNQTEATRKRTGRLVSDDRRSFNAILGPVTPGDSGAPVVHSSDGKALGILSVLGIPSARGTTMERVLFLLRRAGFDVSLVVGPGPRREPLRSGHILGGFLVMAGQTGPDCSETPDCLVWLERDCDPALRHASDPALYTSIVDVADLARLPKRRTLGVELSDGYGVGWGGITVQFWNAECLEIDPRVTYASRRTLSVGEPLRVRIPANARWMTLASWDTMQLEWTLR
jgi:hypothetical protein